MGEKEATMILWSGDCLIETASRFQRGLRMRLKHISSQWTLRLKGSSVVRSPSLLPFIFARSSYRLRLWRLALIFFHFANCFPASWPLCHHILLSRDGFIIAKRRREISRFWCSVIQWASWAWCHPAVRKPRSHHQDKQRCEEKDAIVTDSSGVFLPF